VTEYDGRLRDTSGTQRSDKVAGLGVDDRPADLGSQARNRSDQQCDDRERDRRHPPRGTGGERHVSGSGEQRDRDGEGEDERTVSPGPNVAAELIGMSRDELRALIIEKTGKRPVGNPSMRTLTRMAQEIGR